MGNTAKRFDTKEQAQFEIYGQTGTIEASLKNLSTTGAFLEFSSGSYSPKKGDLLNLTIRLESLKKDHIVAAEVVWTNDAGIGICFVQRDEILERMMAKMSGF
jgi:hypothetical protein